MTSKRWASVAQGPGGNVPAPHSKWKPPSSVEGCAVAGCWMLACPLPHMWPCACLGADFLQWTALGTRGRQGGRPGREQHGSPGNGSPSCSDPLDFLLAMGPSLVSEVDATSTLTGAASPPEPLPRVPPVPPAPLALVPAGLFAHVYSRRQQEMPA